MTFPARRILVPDDLTPASRDAWSWARGLAAPGARLESLFVYDLPPVPVMGLPVPPLSPSAKKELLARMRRGRPDAAELSVEEGDPVSTILRRGRRSDLIALGTHGRRGLALAAFGSVAASVIASSPVPVLAARGPFGAVRSVLAPVNLQAYAFKGLLLGAEAAARLGAELVLLHISPAGAREGNPRYVINSLLERLPPELRAQVRPRLILRGGDPIPGILTESRRHGLLALTAHRKSLLGDLVLGTTVERVVRHANVPVLAAPSSGR